MIRRIAIALAGLAGLLALPAAAAADEIDWMYDPDQVVEIRLGGISEEELDELEVAPAEYVKGTFELLVNGVPKGAQLNDVGIRLKGGVGSGRPVKTGKSGFKVRFDEFVDDQLFFGIKRLTLNNMIQDPSMVHETLTYELFHSLGLPASRTGYAFVKLNGSVYGLFLNLETLDEISLPQWFGEDNTQHLYEADAPGTDVTPGSATAFEVDEGDDEDISDLETLIEAVNDDEGDWTDNVSPFADLEEMTRAWAIERYVAHWDGYAGIDAPFRPNNYYLHSDLAGVFQTMPWGTDQTWEIVDVEFDEPAGGMMFNECLADASCRRLYLEGLSEVRCAVLDADAARAAQLAAMLAPYQSQEDAGRRESSAEEIAEEMKEVESFATVRPGWLEDFLVAEEVLGDGPDPCVEPEEPETEEPGPERPFVTYLVQMPPSTEQSSPVTPAAKLGFISRRGKRLGVDVVSPGHGALLLTVKAAGRRVCRNRSVIGVEPETVHCRLSRVAIAKLEEGALRLGVNVQFLVDGTSFTRQVRLPRL